MAYKRLELIASLINKNEKVLDVGTDHGLVPFFLLSNKITNNIDASDIAEKPLEFAKKNLQKKGYLNDVNLILSDGLKEIDINKYDVIIIAGMGGKTISSIISQKNFNGRYIIHSTTSIDQLRKTIEKNRITIINEIIIKEGKIFNIIIETKPGETLLTDMDIFMGPSLLKKNYSYTNEYYSFLLNRIVKNSDKSNNKNFMKKERVWLEETLWKNKN